MKTAQKLKDADVYLFDLDGTIIPSIDVYDSYEPALISHLVDRLDITKEQFDTMYQETTKKFPKKHFLYRIGRLFRFYFGKNYDESASYIWDYYKTFMSQQNKDFIFPDAIRFLKREEITKKHYVILTNADNERASKIVSELPHKPLGVVSIGDFEGPYGNHDYLTYSLIRDESKPHSRPYNLAKTIVDFVLGPNPDRKYLLVDDVPANLEVAENLGIIPVHIDNSNESWGALLAELNQYR